MTAHPAKFTPRILEVIEQHIKPGWRVLDPFAGVGRVVNIASITPVCVEIEPEWATQIVGNALYLPFADGVFDAVVTSPTFGNRLADHHNAKDGSRRYSYTHTLGRKLHSENSGQIAWGNAYRAFHFKAWKEVVRTLTPGGDFFLDSSDHIRKGEVQRVTQFHEECLDSLGLKVVNRILVTTPRLRYGENRNARVDTETVTILRKGH